MSNFPVFFFALLGSRKTWGEAVRLGNSSGRRVLASETGWTWASAGGDNAHFDTEGKDLEIFCHRRPTAHGPANGVV